MIFLLGILLLFSCGNSGPTAQEVAAAVAAEAAREEAAAAAAAGQLVVGGAISFQSRISVLSQSSITVSTQIRNGSSRTLTGVRAVVTLGTQQQTVGFISGPVDPSTLAPGTSGTINHLVTLDGNYTVESIKTVNVFSIEPSSDAGVGALSTGSMW